MCGSFFFSLSWRVAVAAGTGSSSHGGGECDGGCNSAIAEHCCIFLLGPHVCHDHCVAETKAMIPEPRRLTAKAAIVLMTMTFMLCYFADTLKCSRGNTSTWCVGWGSIGLCGASSDCGDSVDNLAHVSMDESCRTHAHGSATLLLHVIEVRGGVGTTPLGPAVVEELSRKWAASHDSSPFAALLNTSALQDLVKDPDMAAVVLPGRANQSVLLSHDVVDLGLTSTQAGSTARSETVSVGLQELRQQLPLSGSLGGFHSLFPGLRAALQRLSREYGKSAHVCNAAGLVLMVIINPGSQVKPWMTFHDIDGGSSVEQLVLAHAHVRTSVARHISALRTLRAHLNAVWFVGAPLLFPAHTFINFNTSWTSNMATTVISIPPTQQVAGDMREKYCGNPPQQKMSACSDNCREWATHFMSSYAVSYEWRKVARDGHLTSPSEYSRILPYRECFAAVADAESNVPGRKLFDSCTFMNEEGAKLYAQCLVDWENDPHAA